MSQFVRWVPYDSLRDGRYWLAFLDDGEPSLPTPDNHADTIGRRPGVCVWRREQRNC
jgi:hypothetical protein